MNLHINKQDTQELFRYKQMVRFAAREQLCRSLQEKTRDLDSQLAKEMKGPANRTSPSTDEKENISGTVRTSNTKTLMQPRRVSISVRPPQASTQTHMLSTMKLVDYSTIRTLIPQPKMRVSIIATLCPESHMPSTVKPIDYATVRTLIPLRKRRVSLATERPGSQLFPTMSPQNTLKSHIDTGGVRGQLSFARESRKISKLFPPIPELKATPEGEVTPVTSREAST
ncbi:hypothetical protein IFM89_017338 [Coptis chinensis]|uniref:Uncharacterized protein n=1 Tax=Coptis chinensis TaxID=261450 RepID=A0A835H977_9MAGN|nr:hypothetical protein IFM89_017338 [Coptis chinensis]